MGWRLELKEPDETDVARSLYMLTTPLSAPTARNRDDAEREDVTVPSSFWNRSTQRLLLISHLQYTQKFEVTKNINYCEKGHRDNNNKLKFVHSPAAQPNSLVNLPIASASNHAFTIR